MKLTLGFSPCPNDCFIFDALIHNRIDTEGLEFETLLADVETLNTNAFAGKIDITKLSYHAYAYCTEKYVLLNSGSALGSGCGPLLISKRNITQEEIATGNFTIAIPGKYTTANFLCGLAFPNATKKIAIVFSEIEQAVLNEQVDAGLIIHENRFTYAEKGLKKIIDLGAYWEETTGAHIPLGGIVIRRDLPLELQQKVNRVIQRSVAYAFAHRNASMPYVRAHAQEMSDDVMQQHIALYVNAFSENLGEKGRYAVELLFQKAIEKNIIPKPQYDIFLPPA
jgi:1,4-dihydroxy-6-naphthoate synthase